jgi:hypothetical protein
MPQVELEGRGSQRNIASQLSWRRDVRFTPRSSTNKQIILYYSRHSNLVILCTGTLVLSSPI